MRVPVLAFLLFTLALKPCVMAQENELERGDRVRVTTKERGTIEGRLQQRTSDSLLVEVGKDSRVQTVSLADVTSVERSLGPRSRKQAAWSKAKWGALIGAIPGAISLGLQHEQVGENGTSAAGAAALGAWSGGLVGGLIGAAVGATHPGEKWENVTPSFRLLTGRARGLSFAVTFEF